jgi:hypothetical protein
MRAGVVALAMVAVATTACAARPEPATAPASEREIRSLAKQMVTTHPNLFHQVSREDFRASVSELERRAPELEPNELLVELMRLTALPGERDGHTGIFPLDPSHGRRLHLYPVRLYDFPEGLFVVGEVGPLGLIGSRLVAIDGVAVERVVEAARPLVPRDNEWSLRARVPTWLLVAEVLDGLGVVDGVGPLRFEFEAPDGGTRRVTLPPVPVDRYRRALADVFHPMIPVGLPRRARPAYLAHRNDVWRLETLSQGRVVYLAYNRTTVDTASLARRLLRLAAARSVRRVVIDLRHNPGGDNTTYAPLLEALNSRRIDRPGRLVVLIGRTTFSAAANFATDVDRTTSAVFVGEPTGGSPNLYGDPIAVPLTVGAYTANVASLYWEKGGPGDARLAVEPAVRVELTAADFFAGRDPVLRSAVALRLP